MIGMDEVSSQASQISDQNANGKRGKKIDTHEVRTRASEETRNVW